MVIVVYAMLGIVFRWSKLFPMNAELDKHLINIGYEPNFFFKIWSHDSSFTAPKTCTRYVKQSVTDLLLFP